MIGNAAMIGVPMVSESTLLVTVYLCPLGLLALIALLNKEVKIVEKSNIKFFIVEVVMAGIAVAIILTNSLIQTYVLLIVQVASIVAIVVEMSLEYYAGIDLSVPDSGRKSGRKSSNKVHPVDN